MVFETTCFASGEATTPPRGTPVGQYIDQDPTPDNNSPSVVASTDLDDFHDGTSDYLSTKDLR